MLFCVGQELAEVGWDSFMYQGVPWLFESRAGAFSYFGLWVLGV